MLMTKTIQESIADLNRDQLPFLILLGAKVLDLDPIEQTCKMEFNVDTQLCHSVDVVQGGFVTAMLDAAMSHVLWGLDHSIVNMSSLEIHTTYLEPTRAGKILAEGKIVKAGYKTGFFEAKLYTSDGVLTATGTSVGKLSRKVD
ncbi:Uncharacterised protein [Zhongshania aliphaticivorans]|uniref:Thioesterase domain-containing protein n=1 Tax=Zhongshania aliphaticivorans TaxID=1470434 RepID=A0A5S9NS14_9GAMM|nr:PaaI family thioesterase [Zhongshania aliphaticivorans]CAA0093396.1 Uncharacterised protein [Zhongshania aliphaticivorans]CAA0111281.1 Uncharacterised protein [Zhongshania aliphaticivorans]